jgi:hypothetical protein
MELLDRYLQAVRFFLPRRGDQDDIIRELSENLRSQMEDREEELGRPLTDDERADILRRHGHPMLVAGRYRSHQHLIGSVFFPIYVFALKLGLGVALIVTIVLAGIQAMLHGDVVRQFVGGMIAYPGRALMVFAWTTISFAIVDYAQAQLKLGHDWDPRSLPKLGNPERRLSRFDSSIECLASVLALGWLLSIPQAPFLVLGPAAAFLSFAPIWNTVYVPLVLMTIATIVLSAVNFMRPFWTPARSYVRLAISSVSIGVFAALLNVREWLVVRPGAVGPEGASLTKIVEIANRAMEIGIVVALIITVIQIAKELRRLNARRKSPSAASPSALGLL